MNANSAHAWIIPKNLDNFNVTKIEDTTSIVVYGSELNGTGRSLLFTWTHLAGLHAELEAR